MRIVHVNIVRPRGRPEPEQLLGAWRTLGEVAAAVGRGGAEVTVVQSFHKAAELVVEDVRYQFVPEPKLPLTGTGGWPWPIAHAVQTCGPDVIHINGLDFGWHTRVLCGLGVPVLAQDHASTAKGGGMRRRWGLGKVAGVAFTHADQALPFFECGALRRETPVFSVPESSSHFTPGDLDAARRACGVHGDPAVLWVGRLNPNKDPLTALAAIELAARDLPDIRLWCCFHETDLLPQVQARIATSPVLSARVHLLGRRPHAEMETLCRAADFFLLGSRSEGSGYALIEALACGATPIVSDIPPFRSLTGDGWVGGTAPVGDAPAFARALVSLAARPRAQLRERALAHFRRTLSFDAVGARLCEVYAALVEASL